MRGIMEIDFKKILNNLEKIKKGKEACIVVKANAYGMGIDIVDLFLKAGYNFFGVSTLEEALYIRKKAANAKILIFSVIYEEELEIVRKNNLTITVYDKELLKKMTPNDLFHIKFDVGMGRLGFQYEELDEVLEIIQNLKLTPEGIYTHLPEANNEIRTQKEIKLFEDIVNRIKKIINIKYIHLYAGLGALKYNTTFDNLIRPGLAMYGFYGSKEIYLKTQQYLNVTLEEAVKLKTTISYVKKYKGKIGYDGIEEVDGEILTIPLGYHDGMRQEFRGYQIKNVGKIVGKICMCQFMIQTQNGKENIYKKGDFIEIFGENNSLYNLSDYSKVSVYEILSLLGKRIERKYLI